MSENIHEYQHSRHGDIYGENPTHGELEAIREIDVTNLAELNRSSGRPATLPIITAQIRRERGEVRDELAKDVLKEIQVSGTNEQAPTPEPPSDATENLDIPEADTRTLEELRAVYQSQYDKLPDKIKSRCAFEELISRLEANKNHYLDLARGLRGGGELVFIDEEGNPVIREGGTEPVLKGKSYNQTREILYGKEYKEGTSHYGYEMINSRDELRAIEKITDRPFVASENRGEWRETHMESGKNPDFSRCASFSPFRQGIFLLDGRDPDSGFSALGVVRLLRVKKMA